MYKYVRDLPDKFEWVYNTQDIKEVYDIIGYKDEHFYGSLFTLKKNGECIEVYGCETFTPYINQHLDMIYPLTRENENENPQR